SALLRHVPATGAERGPRIAVAQPFPVDLDDARARRPQAGQHLGELALPIASDPATAEPLAGPYGEGDVPQRVDAAVAARGKPPRLETHLADLSRLAPPL